MKRRIQLRVRWINRDTGRVWTGPATDYWGVHDALEAGAAQRPNWIPITEAVL